MASSKPPATEPEASTSPLRYLSGGLEFAVTCLLGALAGRWLDSRLDTDPWLTATLLIVSFAVATWLLLRTLVRASAGSATPEGSDTE